MSGTGNSPFVCVAGPFAWAAALLWATPAAAQSELNLLSADTLELTGVTNIAEVDRSIIAD